MRVDILDRDLFGALDPAELERYLSSNNWLEVRRVSGQVSIWEMRNGTGKPHRVWVPCDPQLGDFAVSMERALKSVALAEDRSQLQVLEDLETVGIGDVIRLGTTDEFDRMSGSLPLDSGIRLVRQARSMASASACSVLDKRAVHPYRRPSQVVEYMRNLRLGQTERGSYLVKLISPIPHTEGDQLVLPETERLVSSPFERQVVEGMMKSLSVLEAISQDVLRRGKFYFEPFEEAVPQGVSANLCEAVASTSDDGRYSAMEVSVSWSYALDHPGGQFERVRFPVRAMPHIARAAEQFREENPEEIRLWGHVTTLQRSELGEPGTITITGMVEGDQHSVRCMLRGGAYTEAIHAHEEGLQVYVEGLLVRRGNRYVLEHTKSFHIVPPQQPRLL